MGQNQGQNALPHIPTAAGVYITSLTADGPGGTDTLIRTNYITTTWPPPVADFSATPLTGTLWAYGDGITSTTSALTHTNIYTRAGVYTVTLSVSDGVVTDTLTRTNYITVSSGTVYTTTSSPIPMRAQPP